MGWVRQLFGRNKSESTSLLNYVMHRAIAQALFSLRGKYPVSSPVFFKLLQKVNFWGTQRLEINDNWVLRRSGQRAVARYYQNVFGKVYIARLGASTTRLVARLGKITGERSPDF